MMRLKRDVPGNGVNMFTTTEPTLHMVVVYDAMLYRTLLSDLLMKNILTYFLLYIVKSVASLFFYERFFEIQYE